MNGDSTVRTIAVMKQMAQRLSLMYRSAFFM